MTCKYREREVSSRTVVSGASESQAHTLRATAGVVVGEHSIPWAYNTNVTNTLEQATPTGTEQKRKREYPLYLGGPVVISRGQR